MKEQFRGGYPEDEADMDFLDELDEFEESGAEYETGPDRYAGQGGRGGQNGVRREARRGSRNASGQEVRRGSRNASGQEARRGSGYTSGRGTRPGESRNAGGRNQRGRGRRRRNPVVPVILVLILLVLVIAAQRVYQAKYGYSRERADLNSYYGISGGDDVAVVCNHEITETKGRLIDGEVYLDLDTVQKDLNPRFYWGITDKLVLYCLPTDMVKVSVGAKERSSDTDGTVTEQYAPAVVSDDGKTLYLALDFVKKFTNFAYQFYSDPNRIVLTTSWGERSTAQITRDTEVRMSGGVKSPILTDAAKGSTVTVLNRMDNWSQVETEDGVIGYVENRRMSDPEKVTDTPVTDYTEPEFASAQLDGKVNMGWHNVANADASDLTFDTATANVKDLNVIAPTWFPVSDDNGDLADYASSAYVEKAHAKGWKVWAVVDNFQIQGVDHNNCIALFERRQNIITQLMNFADQYGFDGINVDFEQLDASYGQDFIEFVRELSIACRGRGLTLSVDNYVTYDFNDFYHMDEQAVFADYVCVMGYDEHYAGSQEAGSVASISYVKQGIERALKEVPASKLINGIPFYMRLWITDSTGAMSVQDLDMPTAQEFLSKHGQTGTWDDTTQQNVVDFEEDGTHYQMWIEDAQSIRSKLGLMQTEGIAGVAEWKLGQETADVWDVIAAYMEGTLGS